MKTYKVLLHRDYIINIDADNEEEAMYLARVLYCRRKRCLKRKKKEEQHSFRINEIEMVTNDAFEVEEGLSN
ncbi:MAG: hypothetical protein U5J96_14555 [Ignavibacteriaceae bacterium]|nr:hypothetical protein [Ignavibacteriaceae bacterium]